MDLPELDEFRRQMALFRSSSSLSTTLKSDGKYALNTLSLEQIADLLRSDSGYYFLLAATQHNRSSLRAGSKTAEAQVVGIRLRKAFAIKSRLPLSADFDSIASNASALRQGDLQRKARGATEAFFRDRLIAEGIPLFMSPPRRVVPGVVISGRKPDGVWPDPSTGAPPVLYVEVKRIQRVADDIQKRLYELAEASLEMKLLYGNISLRGLGLASTIAFDQAAASAALRSQTANHAPIVVGLFLCPRSEAEKYRLGAESLIDRLFFQEEIEECIDFIDEVITQASQPVTLSALELD